jgi:hypothetical protein
MVGVKVTIAITIRYHRLTSRTSQSARTPRSHHRIRHIIDSPVIKDITDIVDIIPYVLFTYSCGFDLDPEKKFRSTTLAKVHSKSQYESCSGLCLKLSGNWEKMYFTRKY